METKASTTISRRPASANGKKTVVIVGAGFAGLNAAKTLSRNSDVEIILVDRRNHHLFQPLLYQVATAGLNPADIAAPIRAQFSASENVMVHLGRVESVDLKERILTVNDANPEVEAKAEVEYDYLIIACGAKHSYFGHPEWETYAPGLKTLEQATEMRRRFLTDFERAENELDPERQKALLTFIVVGAGPTGVELAGAIADISKSVIVNDFHRIDPRSSKIILIEAGPRVLPVFDETLSKKAESDLRDLGVDVRLSTRVEHVGPEGVVANGELIKSECVFWAAGVEAAALNFKPDQPKDRAGRVFVNSDLSLNGYPNVFVIGDMASVKTETGGTVPGLAPAAIQQGRHAAKMISASIEGGERSPFKYYDKGIMATIGKQRAILEVGRVKLTGTIAWFAWLFVHILYLIGFKNRAAVVAQWTWSYLFSKRGARLITSNRWTS